MGTYIVTIDFLSFFEEAVVFFQSISTVDFFGDYPVCNFKGFRNLYKID